MPEDDTTPRDVHVEQHPVPLFVLVLGALATSLAVVLAVRGAVRAALLPLVVGAVAFAYAAEVRRRERCVVAVANAGLAFRANGGPTHSVRFAAITLVRTSHRELELHCDDGACHRLTMVDHGPRALLFAREALARAGVPIEPLG